MIVVDVVNRKVVVGRGEGACHAIHDRRARGTKIRTMSCGHESRVDS